MLAWTWTISIPIGWFHIWVKLNMLWHDDYYRSITPNLNVIWFVAQSWRSPVKNSGMRHSITTIVFSIFGEVDQCGEEGGWWWWWSTILNGAWMFFVMKVFTSSKTPTTTKSLSMLAIASGIDSGWPNVLQASEVPQNHVILKGKGDRRLLLKAQKKGKRK